MLVMLSCGIFSDDALQALPAAAAVEMFHNFTLLHDDIMDNAAVRRGKPSVFARWGQNVAILSGDAMMISSYRLLSGVPPRLLPQILATFNEMALEVCEGQQYDMDFELKSKVSVVDYMHMIELKTSALLSGAVAIGAMLGGASEEDCRKLRRFALELGLAFQLQDDLLDSYGDEELGKAIGGDILEGKKTYLMVTAMSRADESTREVLRRTYRDERLAERGEDRRREADLRPAGRAPPHRTADFAALRPRAGGPGLPLGGPRAHAADARIRRKSGGPGRNNRKKRSGQNARRLPAETARRPKPAGKPGENTARRGRTTEKQSEKLKRSDIEIMAPVGSYESLAAAIQAGADAVYFGVGKLNMRSASAANFSLDDLARIVATAHAAGVKAYLTVNTVVYEEEITTVHEVIDRARAEGVDAVIASDMAAILYARRIGQEVHISTQCNISNSEAVKFYAQWADTVVLARELSLEQVAEIRRRIVENDIRGPRGELVEIEMFAHGALCMSISANATSRSTKRAARPTAAPAASCAAGSTPCATRRPAPSWTWTDAMSSRPRTSARSTSSTACSRRASGC